MPGIDNPNSGLGSLVERIQAGDAAAIVELYQRLEKGLYWFCARQLGAGVDAEDCVQNTILAVIRAIKDRNIHDHDRVYGFARTVAQRQIANVIHNRMRERATASASTCIPQIPDRRLNVEGRLIQQEKVELMRQVLLEMSEKDREILTRFYVQEQTQEQVCGEMKLSETQFRLLKSRAKNRLGELGRKRMASANLKARSRAHFA